MIDSEVEEIKTKWGRLTLDDKIAKVKEETQKIYAGFTPQQMTIVEGAAPVLYEDDLELSDLLKALNFKEFFERNRNKQLSKIKIIKVMASNSQGWSAKFVDAETGQIVPIQQGFTVDFPKPGEHKPITANVKLTIDVVELEQVFVENTVD